MNLQELVAELRGSILRDDSSQIGGPVDSLWSDAQLVRYIDEAQTMLAMRGLIIRDSTTPAVTEVTLSDGVDKYTLHPSVISVLSVRYVGDVLDMHHTGHNVHGIRQIHSQPGWFGDEYAPSAGKPLSWSTDDQFATVSGVNDGITLQIYPAPSADYLAGLQLRVIRKPLVKLTVNDIDTAELEVPEQYHLALLDWAAYRALRNMDSDANGMQKADKFRAAFEDTVNQARKDVMTKMFVPMRWSYGGNGFAWRR